jgi:hypothetical protein
VAAARDAWGDCCGVRGGYDAGDEVEGGAGRGASREIGWGVWESLVGGGRGRLDVQDVIVVRGLVYTLSVLMILFSLLHPHLHPAKSAP